VPEQGSTAALNGTAVNGQINVTAPSIPGCGTSQLTGTYTATTIDFTSSFQCNDQGVNVSATEMIHLTKQ
jgi:hypothetical protein